MISVHELLVRLDKAISLVVWKRPETVSAIAGRKASEGNRGARAFCRVLDLFDRGHCAEAVLAERKP